MGFIENNVLSNKAGSSRGGGTSHWGSGGDPALHQQTLCGAPALTCRVSWSPRTDATPVSKGHVAGMESGL